MMNSRFVEDQSLALAREINSATDAAADVRIGQLFARILGREPTADDTAAARTYVSDYNQQPSSPSSNDRADADPAGWHSLCRILMSSNEFLYVE